MSNRCSATGCTNTIRAKGLCSGHYNQARALEMPPCSVDGCEKPQRAKGLCVDHYTPRLKAQLPPCSVPGCGKPYQSKGLCAGHFSQVERGGEIGPLQAKYGSLSPAELLWSKVDKDGPIKRAELGPCWIWTGYKDKMGYGFAGVDYKVSLAHRLSWEIANGKIADGLDVCHKCDNPPCVNPAHLFLGTHADNMADMMAKGRNAVGSRSGQAKLTEHDIIDIRTLHACYHMSQMDLARQFGVTGTAIHAIVHRRTWKHVP